MTGIDGYAPTQPHARPIRTAAALEWLPLVTCELVIIAYVFSLRWYRTWYIATAAALMLIAFLVVLRAVSLRGATRAVFPIGVYFAYLYIRGFFVEHGAVARWHALAVSIGVAITFLFWVALMHASPRQNSAVWIRVPYYAAVLTVFQLFTAQHLTRTGGWALVVLPFVVPFCWAAVVRKQHRWFAVLALVLTFAVLFIGRSRSPLGAAAIAGFLSFLFMGKGLLQRLRFLLTASVLVAVVGTAAMRFAPARAAIITMYVRLSGNPMVVNGEYIAPDTPDMVRVQLDQLFREMVRDAQPFGIGYRTTASYYEQRHSEPQALHNMYHVWALEGGAVCVLIVFYILARHIRGLAQVILHASSSDLRSLAACTLIGTIALLILGLFHQVHESLTLYAALGMGVAARDRALSENGRR